MSVRASAAGLGRPRVAGGPGDPEVDEIGEVILVEENVGRFHVAVDQAHPVGGIQGLGHTLDDAHRPRGQDDVSWSARRRSVPAPDRLIMPGMRTFEDLVAEADSASVDGWDFSWLDGRATEERPSWGYQHLLSRRLATVSAALDIQTGGGEVLAGAGPFPPTMAAVESWPPNAALATRLLHPRGVVVVATPDESKLPFADEAFDLVTSRHPNSIQWPEIARVLRPGGTYFAQHIGPATVSELVEHFIGPQPEAWARRHPDNEAAEAQAAGLQVVNMRIERLRQEYLDIGAVVYFLRKVIWTVPNFTVHRYQQRLRELHAHIEAEGLFIAHASRVLVEARKPH